MPSIVILHEAQPRYNVSDRLDSLAEERPLISDTLDHNLAPKTSLRTDSAHGPCQYLGIIFPSRPEAANASVEFVSNV
jgi:hypothetical protein